MSHGDSGRVRPRARRATAAVRALGLVIISVVGVAAAAAPASAAPATDVFAVPIVSGSENLGSFQIAGVEPATLTFFDLHVAAHATWSGNPTTSVGWDTNNVRQGADLVVSRSAPLTPGKIDVKWQVTGTLRPLNLFDVDIGTLTLSKDDVVCSTKLSGAGYACTATSGGLTLAETPGVPLSPYVKLVIEAQFDITPEGMIATRGFTIAGNPVAGPTDLSLTGAPAFETLSVPCTSPVGSSVSYSLDPFHWAPATSTTQQPAFQIGVMDPVFGAVELPALFDAPFGPAIHATPSFDLTGPGHTVDLGSLLANNVPPTVDPFGAFGGSEGTPVAFSASTTSQCPIASYVWEFSDGTTSFGPTPKRAFKDNGTFDGKLTVTDETGLSATRSFTVDIANVPPSVNAGPDTTSDWGRLVSFNGQATDPGADDQPTLQYTWDFGDGSPSASGGASVLHAYAAPGDYVATLTVCDKDESPLTCPTDSRTVQVTKRDTTTAYVGDTSGTFDTPATLSASLVDEYGKPVNGRTIALTVGADPSLAGLTNSNGIATRSYTPALAAGSYTGSAAFAGDALYKASDSSSGFTVAKKATATTYTGAVTGAPNKSVVLSAVLKDATGKPLAGRTVAFALGTQSASAVTNGSGVAATSLKLAQKNGTYPVSASYTPAGGDVGFYLGSSQGAVFKLQAK
jgi:hypothetical protein